LIQTFAVIAVSIFLEGLFFILIGAIISSFIEVFVADDIIKKLIPKNKFLALTIVSLLGLIFPICECGIVPVIQKLLKKGALLYICITLLFSSPIVNVVVIVSTYFAFSDNIQIVILRISGGFTISYIIGFIISVFIKKKNVFKQDLFILQDISCSCQNHSQKDDQCSSLGNSYNLKSVINKNNKMIINIKSVIQHSIDEFFDTGKYFIIGVLITSLIQSLIPRNQIINFGKSFAISKLFMIAFPYVLSVCSNTDAFIARSFLNQFSTSALLCFMIFGVMFDIKTTIMLKKIFKISFIFRLLIFVISLTLMYSFFVDFLEKIL